MIGSGKTIISEIEKELEEYNYSEVLKIIFNRDGYGYVVSRPEFDLINVKDWEEVGYRGELFGEIPVYERDIDEKYIIELKDYAQHCLRCENDMYFDQTLDSYYCPNCIDDTSSTKLKLSTKLKRKVFMLLP